MEKKIQTQEALLSRFAASCSNDDVIPVQTNLKSAYTKEDYKTWSTDNCGSAPTADQMEMYLGAGDDAEMCVGLYLKELEEQM